MSLDTPPVTAPRSGASWTAAVVSLFVLGVVIPLVVASHYGALDIPRSDDWSYLVTLFRWIDHGRLGFNDRVSMTLIGQLVVTAPIVAVFGDSIRAVHVFSALIGFGGLIGLFVLAGQLLPCRRGALLIAITIAVGPLWAPLAATYMTDVPAFAVQMVSLAMAVAAVRGPRLALGRLAASLALAFLAISIRQYEFIPAVAVIIVATWVAARGPDRSQLRAVIAMAGTLVIATIGLLAWWSSLPDGLSLSPNPQTSGLIPNLVVQSAGFLRLTGLLLVPVVVWIGPGRIARRAWTASRAITIATVGFATTWLLVTYVRSPATPFVGNYVDRRGVLSTDVLKGSRVLVMPATLFDLLVVAGSIAGILLLLSMVEPGTRLVERLRTRDRALRDPGTAIVVLTVAGFTAAYTIAIATKLPIFDRYALPAIPLVGLLAMATMNRPVPVSVVPEVRVPRHSSGGAIRLVAIGLVLSLFAGVGLLFSTDSAAFDATRWRVDTATVRRGYSPLAVYGGFEWISFHRRRGPIIGKSVAERQRLIKIYTRGLCVDVIVNPRPRVARRAIARATMGGLGHAEVQIVSVRNSRRCAK
ncbi:MAG: hypothetical protein ABJC79_16890 [Acidimicrobiia bacterium]